MRDELEQLLDDDGDMADLYLSRKLAGASSPVSGSGPANWYPTSPTIGSKISKASRASMATVHGDGNDVEDLEMLLEVIFFCVLIYLYLFRSPISKLISKGSFSNAQAYFMQIDGTLNKLTTVCSSNLLNLSYLFHVCLFINKN